MYCNGASCFRYGIAALIVGVFVKDYVLTKSDVILTPDYRPAFYMTMAFSAICVLSVIFIDLTEEDSKYSSEQCTLYSVHCTMYMVERDTKVER